jgi:hypothetical protein
MAQKGAEQLDDSLQQTIDSLFDKGFSAKQILKHIQSHIQDDLEKLEQTQKQSKQKELSLPSCIFDNSSLSALETIVKYLKEHKDLRFTNIAKLLNRDQRAINTTYRVSKKKMLLPLQIKESKYHIPVSLFTNRELSVLENLVSYLKQEHSLSYRKIGLVLRRNERTIWTTYQRAIKKQGGTKE